MSATLEAVQLAADLRDSFEAQGGVTIEHDLTAIILNDCIDLEETATMMIEKGWKRK
nr:hypothetical protein [Rhodococcus sp. (in: high G+C Gram-positive bacteria)]